VIVGYACGDGLGHLTRLRAVMRERGRDDPVTVITGSRHAGDPRVVGDWQVVAAPRPVSRAWIASTLHEFAPTELIVDTFPAGLDGELDASVVPAGTAVTHLARYLWWDRYSALLPARPLPFSRTWLVEPVGEDQWAFLDVDPNQEPGAVVPPGSVRGRPRAVLPQFP
jgi:hypothetical protein